MRERGQFTAVAVGTAVTVAAGRGGGSTGPAPEDGLGFLRVTIVEETMPCGVSRL